MINGIENYKMLGEHTFSRKSRKNECIETLKTHKNIIKELKTKIIDCENDLINNKKYHYLLLLYCTIKNINPCIVFKNIYFIYDNTENPSFIVHKVNGLYGYEPFNETLYSGVKTNRYEIQNINKPIKAISNYKIDEIKNIAESLHISLFDDNTKNKQNNVI